ncbi:kinase-like protein [Westerdykella ornata]|uniref:Kinase-like protein n=1 Tax=Westerdykella ornata TaxID=318751 RepID=A0A6A6J8H8_WESOR|nr:kinase-like protein [Westerdykella ornata]KAF2272871.1 kinase-like protein [Westerdykella ornata]
MANERIQTGPHLSIDYQKLVFLAAGSSGIVYAIDEEKVLKEYHSEGIDVERRAFERLGLHRNIVRCFGAIDNGIILERGQSLRKVIEESGAEQIPLDKRIRWLQEAAEGTRYLHEKGIIHADVGCNNWIIVHGRLKIIDFEGCSIDGEEAGACYEWFSYRQSTPVISRKTDIFAFGCAVYEVMTGRQPHQELAASDDRMLRIKQLYADNHFPEVENIPLGSLMQGCWHGTFTSMDEVLQDLEVAGVPVTRKADSGVQSVMATIFDYLASWRTR